ncbi:MAG TPA: hypothetical protein VH040_15830 [Usitatibacter sp.]|jgi:hypothetical protein|nr:hypothetical protein [Usitatibacter sp.]
MKNRTELAAADLYVLLQRELRRRQANCTDCFMQLPFRVDRNDPDAPNWEVVMPPPCNHGCAGLIDELVFEFGQLYDLRGDTERAH